MGGRRPDVLRVRYGELVPSSTYLLFRAAILGRKQVTCVYRGKRRKLCPHVLGFKNGRERVLAYQFEGESNSNLPPGGEWRCLHLDDVLQAGMRDGDWHTGERHGTAQTCIDIVDVDVSR
jgi:predicted DNA-binding transcriptional regulator YafY